MRSALILITAPSDSMSQTGRLLSGLEQLIAFSTFPLPATVGVLCAFLFLPAGVVQPNALRPLRTARRGFGRYRGAPCAARPRILLPTQPVPFLRFSRTFPGARWRPCFSLSSLQTLALRILMFLSEMVSPLFRPGCRPDGNAKVSAESPSLPIRGHSRQRRVTLSPTTKLWSFRKDMR